MQDIGSILHSNHKTNLNNQTDSDLLHFLEME